MLYPYPGHMLLFYRIRKLLSMSLIKHLNYLNYYHLLSQPFPQRYQPGNQEALSRKVESVSYIFFCFRLLSLTRTYYGKFGCHILLSKKATHLLSVDYDYGSPIRRCPMNKIPRTQKNRLQASRVGRYQVNQKFGRWICVTFFYKLLNLNNSGESEVSLRWRNRIRKIQWRTITIITFQVNRQKKDLKPFQNYSVYWSTMSCRQKDPRPAVSRTIPASRYPEVRSYGPALVGLAGR